MIKRLFPLLAISLFFSGCIEQEVVLDKENTTGKVSYSINFSKIFDNFLSYQNKLENFPLNDNILFNKEKLDGILNTTEKIKLINYSKIDDDNGVKYNTTFYFDDIDEINKKIKPILIENKIFKENKVIYCQTRLSLTIFGNFEKIKREFNNLKEDEKHILETYLSLVKIKIIYITPFSITTDVKDKVSFFVKVSDSYAINFFEQDILFKLTKKEDRDVFNTLYKKDKLKNIYTFRQKITDENMKLMENILLSIGYKNEAVFEYTILDLLNSKESIEINLNYKSN